MGQYHKLVNIDKEEVVDAYGLGLGAKQYEHTGCDGSLSDAMYLLCMTSPANGGGDFPLTPISGRWVGDRVLIVGDYTTQNSVNSTVNIPDLETLYDRSFKFKDLTPDVRSAFEKIFEIGYEPKKLGTHEVWQRVI